MACVTFALLMIGCDKNAADNDTLPTLPAAIGPIDPDGKFEQTLVEIDKLIGKRATSTQTSGAVGATYRVTTGSVDKVVSLLDAFAKNAGFVADPSPDAQVQSSQPAPSNSVVKLAKIFKHPNGDFLTMSQVEASAGNTTITLMSIQLMSPARMVPH